MASPANLWSKLKDTIFKAYAKDPGRMLLHTGAIGWLLSSAAQIVAIAFNKKYTNEQKMFLIPQEIGDAAVNIISFYTLTLAIKSIGKRLTRSGKICSKDLAEELTRRGYMLEKGEVRATGKNYAGDWDFNIEKLSDYKNDLERFYKPFNNGSEVIAGLVGSIISSNLLTPVLRNNYASKRQQQMINLFNSKSDKQTDSYNPTPINHVTFDDFRKGSNNRVFYNNGSMKI